MDVETRKTVSDPVMGTEQTITTRAEVPTAEDRSLEKADQTNAWIWYVLGLIEILLALRFAFLLFGANTTGFTSFLYSISDPFVAPFKGIFPNDSNSGGYFETASLLAMAIYALLAWCLSALIEVLTRPRSV